MKPIHVSLDTWALWEKQWERAYAFFNSKGNAKTKSRLKDKWYKSFIESLKEAHAKG